MVNNTRIRASWADELPGQVIVCEHEVASWLQQPPEEARVLVGQAHSRSEAYWHRTWIHWVMPMEGPSESFQNRG